MNKKSIIQIIVITIAFGGSAFVLYNGFFKDKKVQLNVSVLGGTAMVSGSKNIEKILPNGSTFDVENVVNRPDVVYDLVTVPSVDPQTEVGKTESNVVAPLIDVSLPSLSK